MGQNFGDAVGEARGALSLSVEGAAERLGMPISLLQDIESGLVPVNPALRKLFEDSYGMPFEPCETIPRRHAARQPLSYNASEGILKVGELDMEFRFGIDDNDVLFGNFSAAVRRLRRLSPSTPLTLRSADLPMLAQLADLDDPELDSRARFWFGQDPNEGQRFSSLLRLSRPPGQNAA